LEKPRFFKKDNTIKEITKLKTKQLSQALMPNVSEILKLKENFPNLLAKKIENIYKIINDSGKMKPKINMITEGSSRKKILFLWVTIIKSNS